MLWSNYVLSHPLSQVWINTNLTISCGEIDQFGGSLTHRTFNIMEESDLTRIVYIKVTFLQQYTPKCYSDPSMKLWNSPYMLLGENNTSLFYSIYLKFILDIRIDNFIEMAFLTFSSLINRPWKWKKQILTEKLRVKSRNMTFVVSRYDASN